ncbi:MAG: DUF4065 domain-containing protein [Fusobacteriaceae bacterium]|jgi:transcriptional regulator with XRE-family HTH domain|nr:DUF4065 domain-containing protein [Fusobacteriaceae bacterium]
MANIIKLLREKNGFSQVELAEKLNVTRQTLIKYENETTLKTALPHIKKLAEIFDVSPESILEGIIPPEPEYNVIGTQTNKQKREKADIRIDIPQENIEKFKETLLYILGKVGAKPNVGKTVIYKLLYFIDFDYYELYEEQLIGAKYIKNTYGPTPVDFAKITGKMQEDNEIEEIRTKHFNHEQTKYIPVRVANLSILSAREIKHIDHVLEKYSDKSAKELSELSHKDIPWIITDDKGVIPYEAVFYRTADTANRSWSDEL